MDRLFDVLKKLKEQYPGFSRRLTEAEALGRWETAVGPTIAKHARVIRVQESVLFVEVDHPIWKSELHHRKRQILEVMNQGRPDEATAPRAARLGPAQQPLKDVVFLEPRLMRGF